MKGRWERESGFTLIELLAVLMVVALATALVVPRLGSWIEPVRFGAVRSRIADALVIAQTLGRNTGEGVVLVYQPHLLRLVPEGIREEPVVFRLSGEMRIEEVEIDGVRRLPQNGGVRIRMHAIGVCPSHELTMTTESGSEQSRLRVDGFTGEVRFEGD